MIYLLGWKTFFAQESAVCHIYLLDHFLPSKMLPSVPVAYLLSLSVNLSEFTILIQTVCRKKLHLNDNEVVLSALGSFSSCCRCSDFHQPSILKKSYFLSFNQPLLGHILLLRASLKPITNNSISMLLVCDWFNPHFHNRRPEHWSRIKVNVSL